MIQYNRLEAQIPNLKQTKIKTQKAKRSRNRYIETLKWQEEPM